MKLTTLILIACGLSCLALAVPSASAALMPEIVADDSDGEVPPDDPCACPASFSASNLSTCKISLYWAGVVTPGQCADGDCPDDKASACQWGGSLTVVNNKSTPQTVVIWPTVQGFTGNGPKTLKQGEAYTKTGIFKSVDCGDGFQDYIYVYDMGPFGQDCQASLTMVCGRCQASY